MKKLNFSKGLLVGLLTLALCLACFGLSRASAWTITLNINGGSGSNTSISGDGDSGETTLPTMPAGWVAPEGKQFAGWSATSGGAKVSGKVSVSGDPTYYAVWEDKPAQLVSTAYDAASDSIVVTTDKANTTVYFAIVKEATKTELKANSFKASATTSASADDTGNYTASISLSDKNSKLKTAESKDAYIVATLSKPSGNAKGEFTPVVKAAKTDIKKATVNFDYVSAISGNPALAISSIEITPVTGDKYTSVKDDAKWDGLIDRLQYSTDDGKTWKDVKVSSVSAEATSVSADATIIPVAINSDSGETANSSESTVSGEETAAVTGFTCGELFTMTQQTKAPKVYFRLKGTDGTGNAGPAVRTSKVFKVGVKKAGKAEKALKINAATNMIVIKNGYDFFVTSSSGEVPSLTNYGAWRTILPANNAGTATNAIIGTEEYVPYKKPVDTDANSKKYFTTKKIKGLTVEEFFGEFDVNIGGEDVYVFIRKSAGLGKPAGQWTTTGFKLAQQIAEPTPTTQSGEATIIASQGTKGELKGQFSGSGSALEVLVVKKTTDLDKIDWSKTKWAKYDSSKGITVGKTNTKVTVGDSTEKVTLDKDCYVLVRYAGDSKKLILASDYTKTGIETSTSGSDTISKWITLE